MTRDEFKILVKAMKAVYVHPSFIPDQHAFDVWYEMLKDLDYKTANYAVKQYMQLEEREPTVSSIRKHAASLVSSNNDELNEMVAWSMVQKALKNSSYHAEEEFEKLPPVVQRAVSSPGQLKEWASMENLDGKATNVMQSNFMRAYRVEAQREKERSKLSPELLTILGKKLSISQEARKAITVSSEDIADERLKALENSVPMPEKARKRLQEILNGH